MQNLPFSLMRACKEKSQACKRFVIIVIMIIITIWIIIEEKSRVSPVQMYNQTLLKFHLCNSMLFMRGSRKFCQKGLTYEVRKDANIT